VCRKISANLILVLYEQLGTGVRYSTKIIAWSAALSFVITANAENKLQTLPHQDPLVPQLREAWAECRETFGPENVLIVSNSVGTGGDAGGIRVSYIFGFF
jgi:Mitochondrial PGP phosphatase